MDEKSQAQTLSAFCLIFNHVEQLLQIEMSLLLCVIWPFVRQK